MEGSLDELIDSLINDDQKQKVALHLETDEN